MATVIRSLGISGYPPGVKAAIIFCIAVTTIVVLATVLKKGPAGLEKPGSNIPSKL
jgi:hypothetical protein